MYIHRYHRFQGTLCLWAAGRVKTVTACGGMTPARDNTELSAPELSAPPPRTNHLLLRSSRRARLPSPGCPPLCFLLKVGILTLSLLAPPPPPNVSALACVSSPENTQHIIPPARFWVCWPTSAAASTPAALVLRLDFYADGKRWLQKGCVFRVLSTYASLIIEFRVPGWSAGGHEFCIAYRPTTWFILPSEHAKTIPQRGRYAIVVSVGEILSSPGNCLFSSPSTD